MEGFTESDARRVAADWHGGQWSALYSFASSGSRARVAEILADEIPECLGDLAVRIDHGPEAGKAEALADRDELYALRDYLADEG